MPMNQWQKWLDETINGASDREVALAVGEIFSNGSLSRWRREDATPSPEALIAIARAYDANPIDALASAGYLDDADIQSADLIAAIKSANSQQLIEEIFRRSLMGALIDVPTDNDQKTEIQ